MAKLEDYLERLREVHGDKYTYLRMDVKGWNFSITFSCPEHGEHTQGLHNHLKGRGCRKCGSAARKRTFADWVASFRKVHGDAYSYLRVEEVNGNAYVHYLCEKHGEHRQTAHDHLKGAGCVRCAYASRKRTESDWIEAFKAVHGTTYGYLGMEEKREGYFNVLAVCPDHGEVKIDANTHLAGAGCRLCAWKSAGEKNKVSREEYVERARSVHGELYTYGDLVEPGPLQKLEVFCPEHGLFVQRISGHLSGYGCPKCVGVISRPNLELQGFLESHGAETRLEERIPGTTKKMDIFLPAQQLGIEYHGNIWHSSRWQRSDDAHLTRLQLAQAAGIRLIQIFSDEWTCRRQAVELLLKRAAGVPEAAVHGRKCTIVDVSHKDASSFYDLWHVQGKTTASSQYVGLQHGDDLVAVMGFSYNTSARREKAAQHKVELTRFATCRSVRGGFSKLLQHWLKSHPDVEQVVSYSDNRLFLGRMYEACGFVKDGEVPMDYTYLDQRTDKRLHKSHFQKSKLRKLLGEQYDDSQTEKQMTHAAKIFRIYDCGKTRWVFNACTWRSCSSAGAGRR
jgi:hypothetical protein